MQFLLRQGPAGALAILLLISTLVTASAVLGVAAAMVARNMFG